MILISSNSIKFRLRKYERFCVFRFDCIIVIVWDVDYVEPRLISMHRVEDNLRRQAGTLADVTIATQNTGTKSCLHDHCRLKGCWSA